MRYYILTTAKFADECIIFEKYGSTNSNWLANIELNDIVFISQFNYKSQNIYGPFKVNKTLFYDKNIIFPNKKYFYRIKIKPLELKIINETDLYLHGIQTKNKDFSFKLINLIQQNKHLHSVCLNNFEGQFIITTLNNFGKKIKIKKRICLLDSEKSKVDLKFLIDKNKLFKNLAFSSESNLETFILLALKQKNGYLYNQISKILNNFSKNNIKSSKIYNQFIFGNAYPSDIAILNKNNINIFELKKDYLGKNLLPAIQKEMIKHCHYSLFSNRLQNIKIEKMNFFLVVLKNNQNLKFKQTIENLFVNTVKPLNNFRKHNFLILQYCIKKNQVFLEKL